MTSDHEDVARAVASLGGETLPYRTFRTSNSILGHGSNSIRDDASDEEASDFPLLAVSLPGSTALLRTPAGTAITFDEKASDFPLLAAASPGSTALLLAPVGAAVTAADLEEAFQASHPPGDQTAPAAEPATDTPHHPGARADASRPLPPQNRKATPSLPLEDVFRALCGEPASAPPNAAGHDSDLSAVFRKL